MANQIYTKDQLYSLGPQRTYSGDASEAAFLLGGIGTGNVSIGARGELKDWEIFNRPGKGNRMPYTFFAIWAEKEGADPVVKVLESQIQPPHSKSHGYDSSEVAGLPRLQSSKMRGEYPFVWVDFYDDELPVNVSLEAFTPFIPLNADDSGIPGAIIRYKVKNTSDSPVKVSIMGSLANAAGHGGYNEFRSFIPNPKAFNEYRNKDGIKGLFYTSAEKEHSLKYGNMALMTQNDSVTYKTNWLDGGWWDGIHDLWDDFCEDGLLEAESKFEGTGNRLNYFQLKVGSLGIYQVVEAKQEKIFEFILTWYFPNRVKNWDEDSCCCSNGECETVRNYYATLFKDAWHAGEYILENLERLEKQTRDFHRALFGSTLPPLCY